MILCGSKSSINFIFTIKGSSLRVSYGMQISQQAMYLAANCSLLQVHLGFLKGLFNDKSYRNIYLKKRKEAPFRNSFLLRTQTKRVTVILSLPKKHINFAANKSSGKIQVSIAV